MFRRKPWRPPPLKLPASGIGGGSAEWPSLDSPTFSHASDDEDRRRQQEPSGAKARQQGPSGRSSQPQDERPPLQQRARSTPVLPKLKLGKVNREPLQQLDPPAANRRPEGKAASNAERGNERHVPPLAVPALVLEDTVNGASSSDALRSTSLSARRRPPPSASASSSSRQGSPRSSRKGRGQKAPGPVPELPLREEEQEEPRSTRSKTPRGSMPRLSLGRLPHAPGPQRQGLGRRRPGEQEAKHRQGSVEAAAASAPGGHGGHEAEGVEDATRGRGPGAGAARAAPDTKGSRGIRGAREEGATSLGATKAPPPPPEQQEQQQQLEAGRQGGGGVPLSFSSSPSEAASRALEAMRSPDGPEQLRGSKALAELVQDPAGCEAASATGAVGILAGLLCAAEAEAKAAHKLLLRNKPPAAAAAAAGGAGAVVVLLLLLLVTWRRSTRLRSRPSRPSFSFFPGAWRTEGPFGPGAATTAAAVEEEGKEEEGARQGPRMEEGRRCGAWCGSWGPPRRPGAPRSGRAGPSPPGSRPLRLGSWRSLPCGVMTEHEGDRQAVHGAGGVPALLGLLEDESSPQGIRENAAGALGNLAAGAGNVKAALRCSGAVPLLVGLLGGASFRGRGRRAGRRRSGRGRPGRVCVRGPHEHVSQEPSQPPGEAPSHLPLCLPLPF